MVSLRSLLIFISLINNFKNWGKIQKEKYCALFLKQMLRSLFRNIFFLPDYWHFMKNWIKVIVTLLQALACQIILSKIAWKFPKLPNDYSVIQLFELTLKCSLKYMCNVFSTGIASESFHDCHKRLPQTSWDIPCVTIRSKPLNSVHILSPWQRQIQDFPEEGRQLIITARVRSTREGNVLTSVCPSICLSTGGGVRSGRGGVSGLAGGGSGPAGGGGQPRYDNSRSHCYTAGGMPLAFTQEDFLVWPFFPQKTAWKMK